MCLGPQTWAPGGRHVRKPAHLPPPLCCLLPTGKYIENHGVVHNMYYNTTSKVKLPYHATLGVQMWWDNGSLPIWITAQRQVMPPQTAVGREGKEGPGPERPFETHAGPLPALESWAPSIEGPWGRWVPPCPVLSGALGPSRAAPSSRWEGILHPWTPGSGRGVPTGKIMSLDQKAHNNETA